MNAAERSAKRRGRRRALRARVCVYGGILVAALGFYYYQPNRFDLFPKKPPRANPPVDPDSGLLFRRGTRVTIVTAHPDDSEFFLGGLLTRLAASGARISLIVCTDGDKSFYPWENGARNRRVRRAEQLDAFRMWHGESLYFLGRPDGRLRADSALKASLAALLAKLKPQYLLGFDPEYPPRISHGDHRAAGAATMAVAAGSGASWLLMFQTVAPNFVVEITDQWLAQERLLAVHKSQFSGRKLEMIVGTVEAQAEDDGARIGVAYGEAFRCVRLRR